MQLVDDDSDQLVYKASEEQDDLIARGIKLISTKLLDLLALCSLQNLDPDENRFYSLMRHSKWKNSLVAMFDELEAWELKNVGQTQFSKCFQLVVDKIDQVD